jgi:hypothetical protein
MPTNPNVPSTWFTYDWPLKEGQGTSKADYSPANVAPLIEGFASILNADKANVQFIYQNGTTVSHPGDGIYLNSEASKSDDLLRYEEAAKRSTILKLFQDNSPAEIEYFQ